MADQEQNRNETATPFKLEEARKRGSVAKSLDVNSFTILCAGTAILHFSGSSIATDEMRLFRAIFSNSHQASFEINDISALLLQTFGEAIILLAPLFATLIVVAVLSNFLQTGPVFSFFTLKPDFDRLNPVSGFKRIFSVRLIFESIKTVLKFSVLGAILYFALRAGIPTLLRSINATPTALGQLILPQASAILTKLLAALAVITALDAVYSRWDFSRRMRMSRREIGEEHKRREGDPRIKARLRELQREAVKRAKSLGRVKDADVLITNPTQLAIAIKYDRDRIDAPVVVAKGAGFLAARMRDIARQHRIPMIENRPLARALFHKVSLEEAVPVEHYNALARILVWVYSLRNQQPAGNHA